MAYDEKKPQRRSIRLNGYNYSREGLYFITLCCLNGAHLFGQVIEAKMELNEAGKIVAREWKKTPQIRKNTALHEYIVMPNHFHAIIEILITQNPAPKPEPPTFKSPSQTIGAIIRGFKAASTTKLKQHYYPKDPHTGELRFARSSEPRFTRSSANKPPFGPTDKIWQRNYYDIIIRNEAAYKNISNYIKNNPAKWQQDKFNR